MGMKSTPSRFVAAADPAEHVADVIDAEGDEEGDHAVGEILPAEDEDDQEAEEDAGVGEEVGDAVADEVEVDDGDAPEEEDGVGEEEAEGGGGHAVARQCAARRPAKAAVRAKTESGEGNQSLKSLMRTSLVPPSS